VKIYPLAMTQVHWPTFIKVCQEELGYSPTRGLDEVGIKPDAPCAFLAAIGMDNDPINQLRFGHHTGTAWKHVSASFIATVSQKVLYQLDNYTDLQISGNKIAESNDYLIIATGSIREWRDAVIRCCRIDSKLHKEIREMMNYVLVYFQESGFREVWHDCEKIGLEDGTFRVKIR